MAYLNKNLALEKPQAIARLDNVLDSQAIPRTPRPSVEEGERRRSGLPHTTVLCISIPIDAGAGVTRPRPYCCQLRLKPIFVVLVQKVVIPNLE
jgi:hypothetical protein